LAELEGRLPAVLRGEERPGDEAERLAFADVAYKKSLPATAARLYIEAFASDRRLEGDLRAQHRYNAACAAALAGSGRGEDDPPPDEPARRRLRWQALAWLGADLDAWAAALGRTNEQGRATVRWTLRRWEVDPDLAGLRDEPALARLDGEERAACRALWRRVAAVLGDAAFPADPFGRQADR
jgi:hypothetical protein